MTRVHEPESVEEAIALLSSLGSHGAALAGGTWIMRAPLADEPLLPEYVSLRRLEELRGARRTNGEIRVGALATHTDIGMLDDGGGPLGALVEAARRSAFPAVRNVATLGGNLSAPFPEADLVPALLAADARLDVAVPGTTKVLDVASWLARPRPSDALLLAARLPLVPDRRSWFERLTVRAGAEYSLVSIAVSVDVGPGEVVSAARIAVGAVQESPARVEAAEAALIGARLDGDSAEAAGRAAAQALTSRDGLDAPGWYRRAVLPAMVVRVVARLGR